MNDITFKVTIIKKFAFIMLVLGFLTPSLVFIRNFIILLDPNTDLSNSSSWEKSHLGLIANIFLLGSIFFFILTIFFFIRVLKLFKSKILIQNNQLIVVKFRSNYSIDLQEIFQVVEYEKGANALGNLVRWILVKCSNGTRQKIDTADFEPIDILGLIALLDSKAKIKNSSLSFNDIHKIKWF